jgi:glucose-6-phosphate isomerase
MVDLTAIAGFALHFNPNTLEIEAGDGMVFRRSTRYGRDVKEVVSMPERVSPNDPAYMMDILDGAPTEIQDVLDRYQLTYSLVLLPPRKIGNEFVKTTGHYHPPIPGTALGYPEVYIQLYGRLFLVLQRRSAENPAVIMDYVVVEMTPGFTITIPPNYAHCLVNATGEPALMAGLYGKGFKPDYQMTRERHGLAYYLVAGQDGKPEAVPNPHYAEHPEISWLKSLDGTHFAPDFADQPVWSSFLQNPDAFAFLTQAGPARNKFPSWK